MTLCACPCHKQPGPGYEGHPAPGDAPRANLMIGLIGENGGPAVPVPYCWVCAFALTQRLYMIHYRADSQTYADPRPTDAEAVAQMMRYANEGGPK